MACQHSHDDRTLRLQAEAGEDDFIHFPSGPDRVARERQEEGKKSNKFDLQLLSQYGSTTTCLSRSVSEIRRYVAGTTSSLQTTPLMKSGGKRKRRALLRVGCADSHRQVTASGALWKSDRLESGTHGVRFPHFPI